MFSNTFKFYTFVCVCHRIFSVFSLPRYLRGKGHDWRSIYYIMNPGNLIAISRVAETVHRFAILLLFFLLPFNEYHFIFNLMELYVWRLDLWRASLVGINCSFICKRIDKCPNMFNRGAWWTPLLKEPPVWKFSPLCVPLFGYSRVFSVQIFVSVGQRRTRLTLRLNHTKYIIGSLYRRSLRSENGLAMVRRSIAAGNNLKCSGGVVSIAPGRRCVSRKGQCLNGFVFLRLNEWSRASKLHPSACRSHRNSRLSSKVLHDHRSESGAPRLGISCDGEHHRHIDTVDDIHRADRWTRRGQDVQHLSHRGRRAVLHQNLTIRRT